MKKMLIRSITLVALMALSQPVYPLPEGCYNDDACYKDYVTTDNKDVVIAANRETRDVELYWSNKDNTWLKPDKEYKKVLQKIYDKKLRLMEMQERLDSMQRRSLYTTDENASRGSTQPGK